MSNFVNYTYLNANLEPLGDTSNKACFASVINDISAIWMKQSVDRNNIPTTSNPAKFIRYNYNKCTNYNTPEFQLKYLAHMVTWFDFPGLLLELDPKKILDSGELILNIEGMKPAELFFYLCLIREAKGECHLAEKAHQFDGDRYFDAIVRNSGFGGHAPFCFASLHPDNQKQMFLPEVDAWPDQTPIEIWPMYTYYYAKVDGSRSHISVHSFIMKHLKRKAFDASPANI